MKNRPQTRGRSAHAMEPWFHVAALGDPSAMVRLPATMMEPVVPGANLVRLSAC